MALETCLVTLENKSRVAATLKYVNEHGKNKSLKKGNAKVAVDSIMSITTNGDINDVVVSGGVQIVESKVMDRRYTYKFKANSNGNIIVK